MSRFSIALLSWSSLRFSCEAFVVPPTRLQSTALQADVATMYIPDVDEGVTEEMEEAITVIADNQAALAPGLRENSKFQCDESVEFWRKFQFQTEQAPGTIQRIITPYLVSGSAKARAYWLYHMARSGYFTGNAVAGSVAHVLHERVIRQSEQVAPIYQSTGGMVDYYALLLTEAFLSYEQNWKWVDQGILNFPWDAQLNHKQFNPFFALSETSNLVREAVGVWGRRAQLNGTPVRTWLNQEDTLQYDSFSSSSSSLSDGQYPSYFLNAFHYQTDGWMSSVSAQRYEVSTESLFLGRQDSMQRQTLVPLKKYFSKQAPGSILEVACGTGRYATFARDNFPTSNMTLVDLSPFYLEKARENIGYWQKQRGKAAMKIATGEERPAPKTTQFVQANAERLPFPDDSFDAVTTVYLFHELPHEARVNVAKELARVCKPGGMVVFSDSLQFGDYSALDKTLSRFEKLNEPHYGTYVEEDIPALFEAHGLKCGEKHFNSRTKTLSFFKEV